MKKIVLISSVVALATFSGCTTKYMHKCDLKKGTCEETLYTNSSTVAKNLRVGSDKCVNGVCNPEKPVKPNNINLNIIVKQVPVANDNCDDVPQVQ